VVSPIVVLLMKTLVYGKGSPVWASMTLPLIVWAKQTEPRIKNRKSETNRFFREMILGIMYIRNSTSSLIFFAYWDRRRLPAGSQACLP
jgi:hypothetical protein